MFYYAIKVIASAIIIVLVSEVSKKSAFTGAVFASIPLISLLAIIWLYVETKNKEKIIALSTDIFWLVIPSLLFFVIFPYLLNKGVQFWISLTISILLMLVFYFVMIVIMKKVT